MNNRAGLLWACLFLGGCGPSEIDSAVDAFNDPDRTAAERLSALKSLQSRRDLFPRLEASLREAVSTWNRMRLSRDEEKLVVESLGWLAERKDPDIRIEMELHLDRTTVGTKRLPDDVLVAIALGLGHYPDAASAGPVLWAGVSDPEEKPAVRAACLKSLAAFHPDDLTDRLLKLAPPKEDSWLREFLETLR